MFSVAPSESDDTGTINRLAPTRWLKEGFEDGSIRWERGAKLLMTASVDAS